MNDLIFILGRRSGTSSLAKELFDLKLPVVEPLDKREYPSNLDGHYENLEVRHINNKLWRHFRSNPNSPILFPFLWYRQAHEWLTKHPGLTIVKEPNLCLTWPIWLASIEKEQGGAPTGRKIRAVWSYRSETDVAASHEKWYGDMEDCRVVDWLRVAKFYAHSISFAMEFIDTRVIDLDDPDRISKATEFIMQGEHNAPEETDDLSRGPEPNALGRESRGQGGVREEHPDRDAAVHDEAGAAGEGQERSAV